MKSKRIILLITILVVLTGTLATIRFTTRDVVLEGALKIETSQQTLNVILSDLELTEVKGTIVNGKGEEKEIDAQGILLSNLLEEYQIFEFTEVTAEADDAYSAAVTAEEIAEPGKVFLITPENDGAQLIVFGDPNSKRNVSDVVRLQVQ